MIDDAPASILSLPDDEPGWHTFGLYAAKQTYVEFNRAD